MYVYVHTYIYMYMHPSKFPLIENKTQVAGSQSNIPWFLKGIHLGIGPLRGLLRDLIKGKSLYVLPSPSP